MAGLQLRGLLIAAAASASFLPAGRPGAPPPRMTGSQPEPLVGVGPRPVRVIQLSKGTLGDGMITPTKRAVGPRPQVDERGRRLDEYPEYWYDPRMHTFGNVGLGGRLHALFAPLFTYLIDRLSYGGLDVRRAVLDSLPSNATVLDFCCGTGFSTAAGATGVDTSDEMLAMARLIRPDATFVKGNAETYGETNSVDIVTVMFATHEMPVSGRRRVLRNAARVARNSVVVMDIDPNFERTLASKPQAGASFLAGEPYVLDYLRRIDADIKACVSNFGWGFERQTLLAEHCVVWRLKMERAARVLPFWGI